MRASPRQHLYRPASEQVLGPRNLIIVSNQTEGETGQKAKSTRGSNRAVFALIIIVSLISLTDLLLTLLMLSGKIGPANEESYSAPAKSLQMLENLDFALNKMKTTLNRTNSNLTELESKTDAGFNVLQDDLNMTRSQLRLISDTNEKETLANSVNTTLTRLENVDSALYQLKSALNRTNNDLAELNDTQTKTDVGFNALRDDFNIARGQLLVMSDKNKRDTAATVNTTLTRIENLDSDLNQLKSALNRTDNDLAKLNSTQTKLKSLDCALTQLKVAMNRTETDQAEFNSTQAKTKLIQMAILLCSKLENLDSELTELKSALQKTSDGLVELNRTQSKEKVIYYQTMTPSWIEAHALYLHSKHLSTAEQLTFNASSVHNAALFKVPMIPKDVLQNSTPLTVEIVVFNDVKIGDTEDSDPRYGVSDGISFVGFETVDKDTYSRDYAPCFGIEGTSKSSLTGMRMIKPKSLPRPTDSFYPGQFVITLKLDERWGLCYTAHDGGFLKTAVFNKRLMLSNGLYLEAYKEGKHERVGVKYIKVTIIRGA